jgi:uncharacterized protein YjbI with pentapeptide repeats
MAFTVVKKVKERWTNIEFLQSQNKLISSLSYKNETNIENVDLAGIVIGGNSSVIENPSLYKSILKNIDLSCSVIDVDAQESKWDFVNLVKAKLNRCSLDKSKITDCNFQEATLIITADDTIFNECDFTKAKFGIGTFGYEYGGRRTIFHNCNFTNAIFKNVEFRASKFFNCNFTNTQFITCDLRGIKIGGRSVFKSSQFENTEFPNIENLD